MSTDLSRLVAQAHAASQWRTEVDRLSGSGEFEGVTVEVTGSGAVSSLDVSDAACADGGRTLSQRIVAAVRAAQDDLAAQIRRSAIVTFGEDSEQVRMATAGGEQRLGRTASVIDTDFVQTGDGPIGANR
ncbi:YbaB/EbfC family nucleoid-associated protein [Knoellia subterranea]|nr:YbaB/EbfC family nucleoid-associated protein [Knoellia subterranea]